MNELEVERLVIKDKTGAPRIVLEVDRAGNPSVSLIDRDGKERILLEITEQSDRAEEGNLASVRLIGGVPGPEVRLAAAPHGWGAVSIFDREGEPSVDAGVDSDGNASLTLFHAPRLIPAPDRGGYFKTVPEPYLAVRVIDPGTPRLTMLDRDGRVRFDTEEGPCGLTGYDPGPPATP